MSTPSETMLTATIHARASGERGELLWRARLGVQHDGGCAPARLAQELARSRARGRVGGDHQPAGVAVPAGAHLRQPRVGRGAGCAAGRRAARSRSRCGSGATPRARVQHVVEARLDDVVAGAPLQRAVVGDERDRPADRRRAPRRRRCRRRRPPRRRRRRSARPGSASCRSGTACRRAAASARRCGTRARSPRPTPAPRRGGGPRRR